MSNSSPIPVPIAVMIDWISAFESTLLIRFFSELITFPRSGRIAWKVRSRPSTAEPPAELPSTRKSSADSGSEIWQSASFPGSEFESNAPLALEVLLLLLQERRRARARVRVQRARQRRLEAGEVRSAFGRVDVVRERED